MLGTICTPIHLITQSTLSINRVHHSSLKTHKIQGFFLDDWPQDIHHEPPSCGEGVLNLIQHHIQTSIRKSEGISAQATPINTNSILITIVQAGLFALALVVKECGAGESAIKPRYATQNLISITTDENITANKNINIGSGI